MGRSSVTFQLKLGLPELYFIMLQISILRVPLIYRITTLNMGERMLILQVSHQNLKLNIG